MQQQCPNAFQMGSALLSVLGPAASPGWSLQPALGMRCSRPQGPGLGTCWGDRHQPNASGRCRALGGPWMGKGLCRGYQPGCTQGKDGCSSWGLLGNRHPRLCRDWAPLGMVPPAQCRGCGGDAQPAVPQPRTCPRGRQVPSGRWPRGSAGPVRPGSRGVRQHMIRARGQGLRSVSHTQAAALTSPRAGAAPHVSRSPKAALTRRSGPMVRPLRYRGAGIAPIATDGSPELPLALVPANIVSLVLRPEGSR